MLSHLSYPLHVCPSSKTDWEDGILSKHWRGVLLPLIIRFEKMACFLVSNYCERYSNKNGFRSQHHADVKMHIEGSM